MDPLRSFLIYLALTVLLLGCHSLEPIPLSQSAEETRKSLLHRIPIGTPLANARMELKKNRFRCTDWPSADYWGKPGEPYIYCSRRKGIGIATDREWQIALFYTNNVVSEVQVKVRVVNY